MKEFECDCGFKWLEGKSGEHNCGPFYMEKVDGLKQEIAELTGRLSSHEKLCAAGIYYTEEELDASKYQWDKVAIFGAGEHLRQVMIEHPYCDHVQVVRSYFDLSRNANKLLGDTNES